MWEYKETEDQNARFMMYRHMFLINNNKILEANLWREYDAHHQAASRLHSFFPQIQDKDTVQPVCKHTQ